MEYTKFVDEIEFISNNKTILCKAAKFRYLLKLSQVWKIIGITWQIKLLGVDSINCILKGEIFVYEVIRVMILN